MRAFWLTAYEPEIQHELMGLGHHNLGALIPSGVVLTGLVYLACGAAAPPAGLAQWLVCSVAARVLAAVLWWRYRPVVRAARPSPRQLRSWMWAHGLALLLLGMSVGLLGALYLPAAVAAGSPSAAMQNLFLTMAFLGATAYSAAGTGTHDLPAFLISLVCAAVVMLLQVPAAFGSHALPVAGMCLVFCTLMVAVGVRAHRLLLSNIRLRLANERLAAEQAAAADRARQANREKSDFLAAASHDLRQPVHALLLLVASLQRQTRPGGADIPPPAPYHRLVDSIGEAAEAIASQFNGLMDLSRLESGHQPVLPAPLDLEALLRQLVARHGAELTDGQPLRLDLRIARQAAGVCLLTDRLLLERILSNLIGNALRYTARGRVLVTLRARRDGGLRLSVHDTGIGIAAGAQAQIFEPYVQLGNAQRDRRQGLGLGLAIARECASRLGLRLQLASTPGRGSRFDVLLPASLRCAAPQTAPLGRTALAGLAGASAEAALAGRRVLLIDDDPMVRDAMARLMQSWQVDLRLARDGQDAVIDQCLREGWAPELLLCDQRLPGEQQGLQLLDALQQHWPEASALLQTGEPPERVAAEAEAAGYPVLYKPVTAAQLSQALRALLRPRAIEPTATFRAPPAAAASTWTS